MSFLRPLNDGCGGDAGANGQLLDAGEIAKTQRVRGNVLDAVEPSKMSAETAARLIKQI